MDSLVNRPPMTTFPGDEDPFDERGRDLIEGQHAQRVFVLKLLGSGTFSDVYLARSSQGFVTST